MPLHTSSSPPLQRSPPPRLLPLSIDTPPSSSDERSLLITSSTRQRVYTPPPDPSSPTHSPSHSTSSSPHPSSSRTPSPSTSLTLSDFMDPTPLFSDEEQGQPLKPSSAHSHLPSSTPLSDPPSPTSSSSSARRRRLLLLTLLIALPLVTLLACLPLLIPLLSPSPSPPTPFTPFSTCDIFCTGPLLSAYQLAGLFDDSKTFVDFSLRSSPSDVYRAFTSLTAPLTNVTLLTFLHTHFDTNTSDLLPWTIPDWTPQPPPLAPIIDRRFAGFAAALNLLWFSLGRTVHPDVYAHPERHTLLPLLHPHMIVPGGRFREFYYWDSYWIVRGLLLCNMTQTARMVIDNLAWMVAEYGFVPNGSRQYYLTRSQPPFLTLMVDYYHHWTGDDAWLRGVLPTLDDEYGYWMTLGEHAVEVRDRHNRTWVLNRYFASVQYPRPESYAEDVATAHRLAQERVRRRNCTGVDPDCDTSDSWSPQALHLFSELTAVAETGWDFSSRWFADRRNISSAEASHIIPVDLNAVLYQVERLLAKLWNHTGDAERAATYTTAADTRLDAMHAVLFDSGEEGGVGGGHYVWRDYDYVSGVLDGDVNVLSNYVPLWTHAYDTTRVNVSRVIDTLLHNGLVQAGGLLTTLDDIDQQWDCPNAWPPLQHMIYEGIATSNYTPANRTLQDVLARLAGSLAGPLSSPYVPVPHASAAGSNASRSLAYYLSSSWLYGNIALFNTTGIMSANPPAPLTSTADPHKRSVDC